MTTELPLPEPGARVVLRYRLPAGSSHPMTDVIGTLEATGTRIRVRAADGHQVEVARDRVVALKELGPRPVRTKEIRAVEAALALSGPTSASSWIGGWWARAHPGSGPEHNAALPLADSPMRGAGALADLLDDETVDRVFRWYAERELPALLQIPDRLARPPEGWAAHDEQVVLTAAISTRRSEVGDATIRDRPGPEWTGPEFSAARFSAAGFSVVDPVCDHAGFATLRDETGTVLALACATVPTTPDGVPRMVLRQVQVPPDRRRAGSGRRICTDLMSWGERLGARMCIARVPAADIEASAFLHALGLTEHHRSRFASRRP